MVRNGDRLRAWRRFARNKLSVLGMVLIFLVVISAVFAPVLAPYPEHAGVAVNFIDANRSPDATYWLGTDSVGRDVLSRIMFAFRNSLMLGAVVVTLAITVGTAVGMCAAYFGGRIEVVLMRITDIFLAIPSLVLAMAILGLAQPSQFMAMVAMAIAWWPWHARLVYGVVRSLRAEGFVVAAEVLGASPLRIMLSELLPNCAPNLFTKASLDMGFVILLGAALSFLGMGAPPPTPDLGTMVSEGAQYLPDIWWLSVTAGLAIFVLVLGFNLVADGLRDLFDIVG
ncbi:binding-protein-dependent transport system inner membrane protein [Celeribacter indicus]|uniref:Binding-protein-dependent transport system inner membrane protein n=2 Tax=Celeribacter indicus TaxID=1208324 RepID=A0A0B5DUD0_9RHOB|nr:binding-protein-dependent transport system inner membrane protein [Celeribacter indicus]